MLEGNREVDLPLPVAGFPWIIGDHRRPTLRECAAGREDANQFHTQEWEHDAPTLHRLRLRRNKEMRCDRRTQTVAEGSFKLPTTIC